MEDGEDGSELMGQLAALMEQLTNSGGMEGIPQELIEAQRADRRRQKENKDRRIAAAELAAANAPPERVWLDAVKPAISCMPCVDELLLSGEELCPGCRREGRHGGGLPLEVSLAVLYQAAEMNRTGAISRIHETGVDVDTVSPHSDENRTALMVAASSGSYDACRELIRLGASASTVDDHGLNPLLHACWGRSPGCVKELLESAGAVCGAVWGTVSPYLRALCWAPQLTTCLSVGSKPTRTVPCCWPLRSARSGVPMAGW